LKKKKKNRTQYRFVIKEIVMLGVNDREENERFLIELLGSCACWVGLVSQPGSTFFF
jgi:adenine C2-methylase RlmN of 23S rRNA A2503 and tRNA A37